MDTTAKAQLREKHDPHWSSAWVWLGFLAALALGELALLWSLCGGPRWLAVPLVVLLAHAMHAHLIAFHESAHRTLCPSRFWNDAMGLFVGTLSFMSLTLYRAVHHSHHAYLSTERDEELWPFVVPGSPRWARRLTAAFELTLGIVFTPLLFLRSFLREGSSVRGRRTRRRVWLDLAVMLLAWVGILWVTALLSAWRLLLIMYVLPGVLAGNLQSLRKYIEHMGLTGGSVLSSTRSVVSPGPVGRLLASSLFNIPYHGVHHRYGGLPHARMREFAGLLDPTSPEELIPYPNYRAALWEMLGGLSDPRIGSQWLADRPANAGHGGLPAAQLISADGGIPLFPGQPGPEFSSSHGVTHPG